MCAITNTQPYFLLKHGKHIGRGLPVQHAPCSRPPSQSCSFRSQDRCNNNIILITFKTKISLYIFCLAKNRQTHNTAPLKEQVWFVLVGGRKTRATKVAGSFIVKIPTVRTFFTHVGTNSLHIQRVTRGVYIFFPVHCLLWKKQTELAVPEYSLQNKQADVLTARYNANIIHGVLS